MFGFYETRNALLSKAAALGLPAGALIESGQVELLWQPATEALIDELCHRLVDTVRRRKIKRLFIDGLGGFEKLAVEPARLGRIFSALSNEFRALGVTAVYSAEMRLGDDGAALRELEVHGVSSIAENIVMMRYLGMRSSLHRLISVLKVRDARVDDALRKFIIGPGGITIENDHHSAEQLLAEPKHRNLRHYP